jgi:hypothetical protein
MKSSRARRGVATAAGPLPNVEPSDLVQIEGGRINLAQFGVSRYNLTLGPRVGDPDPYNDDCFYPGLGMQADNVTPLT